MTISGTEAREIYDYLQHQYLNPNHWPALRRLLDRISADLKIQDELLEMVKKAS